MDVSRLLPMPVDFTIHDLLRFWGKVDRRGPDECWPWTGVTVKDTDAYGSVNDVRGKFCFKGVRYWAPRVAYYFEYKVDPVGLVIRHTCDNPLCVNPRHLVAGTESDNRRDAFDRGRASHVGSCNVQARLDERHIPAIRARRAAGETYKSIAQSYGVTLQAIHYACNGKNWSHVR